VAVALRHEAMPNYIMLFVLAWGANMNWRELLVPAMMHYLSRYYLN
jgi:hypothetical protein